MLASSPLVVSRGSAREGFRSHAGGRGVDADLRTRVARDEWSLNRVAFVSGESDAGKTRCRIVPRAFDSTSAITGLQDFLLNPSPGLKPAVLANTAVFTSGFGVLRLGLTLAGIVHSWFLGTVRESARIAFEVFHQNLLHADASRLRLGYDDKRQILPSARNARRPTSSPRGPFRERVSTHKFSIRSQQSRDQRRIKTFDANDSTDESKHPSTGCHERVRSGWLRSRVCVLCRR